MTQPASEPSVWAAMHFVWRSMTARRRRHFYVAMAVMLLGAVAELVTIGAVLPFLAIVSNPAQALRMPGFSHVAALVDAEGPRQLILLAALILTAAAILAAVTRIVLTWVSLNFVLVLSNEIGSTVFARMLRQPYSYYVTRNTSELIAGVDKVQAVVWGVLMPVMQGITAAAMSASIIALLFAIDPFTATVAAAVMTVSYVLVSLAVRSRLHRNSERLATAAAQRVQTVQEGLGGIRDILLEQSQEIFDEKFARLDYSYRRAQVVNNFINLSPRFVVEGTGIALIAALAFYLSLQPGGVIAAIPVLGALALGAQRLLPLLQQVYAGWSSLAGNRQVLIDVTHLMDTPVVTSTPRDRSRRVEPFGSEIVLRDVGFQYQTGQNALHHIDLTIRKRARVGFVGETGSGKSTLLDLIMALLEPTTGRILVDGTPLDDGNRAQWQAQIAHVPQAIFLLDSSIASNIAFGEPEAEINLDRVHRAAAMAHIHSFIEGLPESYDTAVGERGVRLSGGQRQRIGIARAFYKRAPVLIFDEATSALDDVTEKAIMRSLATVGADMTVLMIAHRTSTLEDCDLIVRMAGGRIVAIGSYGEIIGTAGRSGSA